ncbi:tumor protein D52 isoform X1 [Acinonyx jubatus]|uniref:Tumor protein D52 n=3 Tax=Felidae TaxID=9681 RepID=A0ABI7W8N9_FELCA|nr:tumor protein D52 isoform X1 [Felis catus]XP_026920136.2 tumor protein D52 isoform X1 [Acinonyx jubatus]
MPAGFASGLHAASMVDSASAPPRSSPWQPSSYPSEPAGPALLAPAPPAAPTWPSAQVGRVRWLGDAPGKRSPPRAGGAAAPTPPGEGTSRESRRRRGGARRGAARRAGVRAIRAGRAAVGGGAEDSRRWAGDMDRGEQGLLRTDPVPEEGEDVAATISATETLSEEEQQELRRELAKVEEEIQTLSQVLAAKEKHLAEIKRKLGINSLQELKQNIAKGWQDVTATSAYKKTSETLSQAGQKASAAFSSVGSVITKKLEDVKMQAFSHSFSIRSIQHSISMPAMRNSPTFKSFEEKVENLKSKVGGTKPAGGDFGEVLNSTANASATSEPLPEQTQGGL